MPDAAPPFDPVTMGGWTPDAPTRPAIQASMPQLAFAAPFLTANKSESCLLYKCWVDDSTFSDYPDYPAQQIGDCVSFGFGHMHDLLQACLVYLGHLPIEDVGRTCTEAMYACGREAAGMLGGLDGCFGSAMLRAVQAMGCLRYNDLPDGQRAYSGERAKLWGRTGLPAEYRSLAATRLLSGAMLASATDMLAALQAGSPCTICTALGFTLQRDQQGFCRPEGRWGHCMGVAGYRADRPGFLVIQSWGPANPAGPIDLGQPTWSFWVDWDVMEAIVSEGDSAAISGTRGFRKERLPSRLTRLKAA